MHTPQYQRIAHDAQQRSQQTLVSHGAPFQYSPLCVGLVSAGLTALLCSTWVSTAQAQSVPTPGTVQGTVPQQRNEQRALPPPVLINQQTDPATTARDQTRFQVKGFTFKGNSVYSEATLRRAVERYQDLQLTLAELDKAADVVTQFYRRTGYPLAQASVPAQRVVDGLVTIQVVEGRIGKVQVTGNKRYTGPLLQGYLESIKNPSNQVAREAALERSLLLMNDAPGLRARALLSPGSEFGQSDIEIKVEETRVQGAFSVNNNGRRDSGKNRADLSVDLLNPLGYGDAFNVRLMKSYDDLFEYGRLGYAFPINNRGTRASIGATHTKYAVGGLFGILGIGGTVETVDFSVAHPFLRTRSRNHTGIVQLRNTRTKQTALGVQLSESNLTVLTLTGQTNWVNPDSSFTSMQGSITTNFQSPKRGNPQEKVLAKLDGEYTHLTGLSPNWDFYLRAAGTLSPQALPDTEKFSIGGADSVRGYAPSDLRGDRGFLMQTEVRRQFPSGGWPGYTSLFMDIGAVNNKGFGGSARAASVGVGAMVYFGKYGRLKMEYAAPVTRYRQPSDGNKDGRVWFTASINF